MYKRSADFQAFTLIELPVVILTIAILMGLVFTAGQGALDRARKTQAKNDVMRVVARHRLAITNIRARTMFFPGNDCPFANPPSEI